MKKVFMFLSFLFLSCQKEISLEEQGIYPSVDSTSIAPVNVAPAVSKTKYLFIVFVVNQPYELRTSTYNGEKLIEKEDRRYTTEIAEIHDSITEDYKYRLLDRSEKKLRETKLNGIRTYYSNVASANNIPSAFADIQIKSREILIFNSYKDASIERQKYLQNE